jgi:hypothetical protein
VHKGSLVTSEFANLSLKWKIDIYFLTKILSWGAMSKGKLDLHYWTQYTR